MCFHGTYSYRRIEFFVLSILTVMFQNEELRLKMIGGTILECPPEHKTFQVKLSDAQKKINQLSKALGSALSQNTTMFEKTISVRINTFFLIYSLLVF